MSDRRAPLLVFGWGNPSRGDDALGPLFVERLQRDCGGDPRIEWLTDFQPQVEHALDLAGRERVLLVDASVVADAPFAVTHPRPRRDASFGSHAISPSALLQAYVDLHDGAAPPPTTLLAIRGAAFELGEALGDDARRHLGTALAWAQGWLREGAPEAAAP